MTRWITRLVYGLLFAIPLMLVTYVFAYAAENPIQAPTEPLNCEQCHETFEMAWKNGAHGNATTDPAFKESWIAQGQPAECLACHTTGFDPETGTYKAEGITCEACHSPIITDHPLAPMSSDRSAELCGKCHTEAHFEWKISKHREEGVDCAACHDPHGAGLKTETAGDLCATCHRSRASNFAHSEHSVEGLDCTDCHLQPTMSGEVGHGAARQDHSFFVSLSTCNDCHEYQMHDPAVVHPERPTPTPADAMAAVEDLPVSGAPAPVSPLGFTMLAGVIGAAFGVIIAPFVDRFSKRRMHPAQES